MMMTSGTDESLQGLRVLVVEDSFLIAWSLRKMLRDMGCDVVGPVATVGAALSLVEIGAFDAAILDINLGNETSAPVADALHDRSKPFFFVTGYTSAALLEMKYKSCRRLRKPLSEAALKTAVIDEFKPS